MSRFLRFFRVFVVAVICGFGALSANAANTSSITVCDDSSDAGNACVRFDSANAGAPTSFTTPLNNNTKLTTFPYKPGYGYAGHYTGRDCGGTQILDHTGVWTGNSATGGNIYACWVQLVHGGINNPFGYIKLFVLNKNGGDTVGNMWPNLDQPVEFNTSDYNYGGIGRSIRFENRGDWVYLRCYDYDNLTGVCNGDVKWYMPRGGGQVFVSVDKFFWSIEGVQELPTRSGYAFGGMYGTSGTTGGTQYCNASGNTINMAYHLSAFDDLPAFNTIYARWNRLKVNLSGNGVSPSTVYLQYGDNWYPTLDRGTPIAALYAMPTDGNNVFNGYYTAPQCQGTQIVNAEDGTFRTDNAALTAITEDNTTIYPCWTAQATWATLTINNQNGGRPWKLYYPLSGCSISGYHTSQDCLNTNVVVSLSDWSNHGVPTRPGWVYGGHWTNTNGTGTQYIMSPYGTFSDEHITGETQVYAKWSFSVALPSGQTTGPNTGCPSGTYCCVFGTECNAPSPTASAPSGQQFAGWECKLRVNSETTNTPCAQQVYPAGGNLADATQVSGVSNITGITLTATWESTGATDVYKRVTLKPNGGTNGTQYIYERYLNDVTQGFYTCQTAGCNQDGSSCTCTNPTAISGSSIFDSGILRPDNDNTFFNGYYTSSSGGSERIDSDGYIQPGLYGNTPAVLYANWLVPQIVQLNLGEHGSWGTCGVTSIQVVAGEPPLESQLSCVPTADTGWRFIGYYDRDNDNGIQYYDANGYAGYPDDVWPTSNAPTELIARYEQIRYAVKYYCGGTTPVYTNYVYNGQQYTVWNGAGVGACAGTAASSSQVGSKLVGWGYGNTGNSGTVAYSVGQNVASFPITSDMNLSMVQMPIYRVTLNHCDTANSNCSEYPISNSPSPSTVYFSNGDWYSDASATTPMSAMNPKPLRIGFDLDGYYKGNTLVIDMDGNFKNGLAANTINANNTSIVANWNVRTYNITLNAQGGSGGTTHLYYRVDKGWRLNSVFDGEPATQITKPNAPSGTNKIFSGYYTEQNGAGTQVIDGQETILYTGTGAGSDAMNLISGLNDMTFYAKWDDMPSAPSNAFTITTTSLAAGETFRFTLAAGGNFYIDWGDGTVDNIVRNWYTPLQYVHTYTSAAPNGKTIKIWGNATGYASYSSGYSAIRFSQGTNAYDSNNTPLLIAGISGSLGAVFPTVEDTGMYPSTMPNFYAAFSGCSNLTTDISTLGTLFSWVENGVRHGVTGAPVGGFAKTFENTGITGNIPVALFAGVSGAAGGMFHGTFKGCTGIESIPAGLFSGVSGVANSMFYETFEGCTGITSIPVNLFSTISATGNATDSAVSMFQGTFKNTGITTLPATLFGPITASGVSKSFIMSEMFANTPLGANTNYYIPKTLFISNNQPIISDTNSGGTLMTDMFNGTNLITDCSIVGLTYYQTDFDDYWGGKKICAPAATFSCALGPDNPLGSGPAPEPIFWDSDAVTSGSFTLPADAGCVAPDYWHKTNNWTLTVNGSNHYWPVSSVFPGTSPSNTGITWDGQQSINFYMSYQKNIFSVALDKNHNDAQNGSVTTLYEVQGTRWSLNPGGNGEVLSLAPNQLPTHGNLAFDGYYDDPDEGEGNLMVAANGDIVASNTTLTDNSQTWYAHWTTSNGPFTVTFSCGDNGHWASGVTPSTFTPQSDVYYNDPQHMLTVPAIAVCTHNPGTNNHDDQGYTNAAWECHFANSNGLVVFGENTEYTTVYGYHDHLNCGPSWVPVRKTITLDKHGGTGGTDTLYTIYGSGSNAGVYLDLDRTQQMKVGENPLTKPSKSVTLTLSLGNSNASIFVNNHVYNGSVGLPYGLAFKGYYSSASSSTRYIKNIGYITSGGMSAGAGYTSDNNTWHAQWEPVAVAPATGSVPVPTWVGHVFAGWWSEATGGTQITDGTGDFVGDGNAPTIDANTTWYAHWTECSHNFGSNPHATKTAMTAVDGMCGYHITCEVPVNGYSQHGGNDTTGAFDFYILPSSTDTLPGCSPRVYPIEYRNVTEHGGTMPANAVGSYTYGVGTEINFAPTSVSEQFASWCVDAGLSSCVTVSQAQQQGYYYQIGNTAYGNKVYYAKWGGCIDGYQTYNYDVMGAVDYNNNGAPEGRYPAGVCAPGNYVITCDSNCPAGETCNACLENFVSVDGVPLHLGQRYGIYTQGWETMVFVTGALGAVLPHSAGVYPDSNGRYLPFGTNYGIRPLYSYADIGGGTTDPLSMPSVSVWQQDDYAAYMSNLAQLNGKTFGRAHYSFNGLWTHQTSEEEQYMYLPTVNGTTPWSQRSADGENLSKFFTSDATVYAHWIPDVYTITLNANGGVDGDVTVLKEKWNTGWSKDNGASYPTAANFGALTSAERPQKTGHTFAGYYTERQTQVGQSCPGTKIVNADGSLNASASSSTGMTVGNAKYFGTDATLYACWAPDEYYITLEPNLGTGAHGTSNDTIIYTKYATGVYTNSARTDQYKMTPNPNGANPVSLPTRYFTITYDPNYDNEETWDPVQVSSTFNGYHRLTSGGTQPFIDNTGYITPNGNSVAKNYTDNNRIWHAHWINGTHDLLLAHRNGYFMDGWYDAPENGNLVGEYMQTKTPTSDMTLYAHWSPCSWTQGDHSTAQYVAPLETDGNVCKYHITCDSGYTHDGDSQFDEIKYSATGTLPECSANRYTITYKDNPAYYNGNSNLYPENTATQYYTYNPDDPVVLNPWEDEDELNSALAAHRASSVQWCDINGNNCKTQLAAGETGNKTFYAKWTCATGYTNTYTYATDTYEYTNNNSFHFAPGMCAPVRYLINCTKNCPTYTNNGTNVTEACNACLEDFKLLSSSDAVGKYRFGSIYNGKAIGRDTMSCGGMLVSGGILPTPVYEMTNIPSDLLFRANYATDACWVYNAPEAVSTSYLSDDANYVDFMETLASQSYNSGLDFGARHYYFDGLWTHQTLEDDQYKYIGAGGLSPTGGAAFHTEEMADMFTSDTNVYAHWEPKVYTIRLCPENGTSCSAGGSMSGGGNLYQKWAEGWRMGSSGNFKVAAVFNNNPIAIPTYDGHDFMGYYTEQQSGDNCQGTKIINANGTLNMDVSNVVGAIQFENEEGSTLYACWNPSAYTVTYNCGVGTGNGSTDNSPRYGQLYTPKDLTAAGCGTTLVGHYFNGWNVTPGHSNSDIKDAGVAFNWDYTADQTFTARWVAKEYHITFNKNGGSGGTSEIWEHYGTASGYWHDANQNHIAIITLPTLTGHTFAGYALNGTVYIPGTTLPASTLDFGDTSNNSTVDITLVAQWDTNGYNIDYDENGGSRLTLPDGYTLLEYVSGGTFDTGLYIGTDDIFEIKYATTEASTAYQFGYRGANSSSSANSFHATYSSGSQVALLAVNSSSNAKTFKATQTIDVPLTIRWNGSVDIRPTANGTAMSVSGSTTEQTNPSQTFVIGGEKVNGTITQSSAAIRIYYFRTFDSDGVSVTHNFVPVKNSSNVIGMYDTITGAFLTKKTTRTPTAGPDATDTQVIDDAYPKRYTYDVGAKVYGVPTRAHSVFDGWCAIEMPNGSLRQCQTIMPYTIAPNATGDKTLHARWTCEAGYIESSDKQSCVGNTITLDWQENNGDYADLTNVECTYGGNLTLPGVPPYDANHVFNGWKTYGNSGIFAANAQITGGCTDTYTGVTSGTSTAITAQWCNACNTTHATCELDASEPGTCSYNNVDCESGYHISPNYDPEEPYNMVCIPYTITYQSDGHGNGATDEVLYNSTFTTNDAKNLSQFNWANHIVTEWTRVSGGDFPNVGGSYTYNVQSDTVLKANWGECHCTPGLYAESCDATSSNNECEVTNIVCDLGYSGGTGSCEGTNCTAWCAENNTHSIMLVPSPQGQGTGGTARLYVIDTNDGTNTGVYLDTDHQQKMTVDSNPITMPTPVAHTVTYDKNASDAVLIGNTTVDTFPKFDGYYASSSDSDTDQYITGDTGNAATSGFITANGIVAGTEPGNMRRWFGKWTYVTVNLPVAYRPGYKFDGWYTDAGNYVGSAGDEYISRSPLMTLYAHWSLCVAGTYCPGFETVNNQTDYNVVHNCPTNYPNSVAGSVRISDCYLLLTPGKWVETTSFGMVNCSADHYCDDNGTKVYHSDETNDGRRTTGIRKSCAANAGSFSRSVAGSDEIGDCYKNVTLNKRGGSGTLGGASGTDNGSTPCRYNQNCTLPDASILQLTGYTFHAGWTDQPDTDCNSTTRVFVVPNDTDTYYACRTMDIYNVTLKDGQNTGVTFATVNVNYDSPMPDIDSNGNDLVVPTHSPVSPNTTHVFKGYFSTSGQSSSSGTQYYNADLTSAHNWTTEGDGTLYAKWYMKCDPGYYLPAGSYACAACPAGRYCVGGSAYAYSSAQDKGLSGYIAAGYYSTGGASVSTPTGSGDGCATGYSCGIVAGGYYSTGGGTSATPTAADDGCLSGSSRSCGKVAGTYFSNGGGKTSTPTATGCVTGQFCGRCPATYRSNTTTGKASITECVASCTDGQWIATAEDPTVNNSSAVGCATPASNRYWSKAHTVAYGSSSPVVSELNAPGRHVCAFSGYQTPTTTNPSDHDDRSDCTRTVTLNKNGGATVDGAQWPNGVTDSGGTEDATVICVEGVTCNFGDPANLLEQTGYTFQHNWAGNEMCTFPIGTSVENANGASYYACKDYINYTLTYSCGTGTTGTAPNQQTGIHYGETVSVSGAGDCAKTGHTFAGWAVSDTSDVITATTWPHNITWGYDSNKTFTAQWTANTYDISYVYNGGTAASLLPDGYTLLEYIESDGNQVIDTGVMGINKRVVLDAMYTGTNVSSYKIPVSYGGDYGATYAAVYANKWGVNSGQLITGAAINNRKTVDVVFDLDSANSNKNRATMTINGTTKSYTRTGAARPDGTLKLFAARLSIGDDAFVGQIYGAKIYDKDTNELLFNGIPARNSNGYLGLYDTVTGEFFTNLGSGSFTADDPVATTVPYPNQYTYGVGATVTGGAVRANSVFDGWCRTAALTNCAAPHEITTTDLGDITLYAKWGCVTGYHNVNNQCVVNEFTLVYNKNGHGTQNTPANQTCTYGQQINLAAALSETGWVFNGWTIAGENYVGGERITCNEEYLGVTGGTVNVDVNVTADWSARCNKIVLSKNSDDADYGDIRFLYAKTLENDGVTNGKWYKDDACTIEYTSTDYADVIPMRSGWAFRGFYANSADAADINATQTNGANRVMTHTGAPTITTGQNFVNGLNASATLYAGWARDCSSSVAHGTCSRTIGQNTTYTTGCANGYHYGTAPNGVTYNPATSNNTSESTYYPNCVPNTITIILDKNGGSGTCAGSAGTDSITVTCNYDGVCETPVWNDTMCAIGKSSKMFAGWNTAADGTGTQYGTATDAGNLQNINNGTASTTLYAKWVDVMCNFEHGTLRSSRVTLNIPICYINCDAGYERTGLYAGEKHNPVVNTGQCTPAKYDISYELNGGSRVGPSGYTLLEYVTADGNQYFDTGIAIKKSYEIRSKFEPTVTNKFLYGVRSATSNDTASATAYIGGSWRWGNRYKSPTVSLNTIHTSVQNVSNVAVDDVAMSYTAQSADFTTPNTLLFGTSRNYDGISPSRFIGNIYEFRILDGNRDDLMNLVPARRDSDDKVGFYDTVSGEFFTSIGSADFVAGPVLSETYTAAYPAGYTLVDYIESTGTQYIVTNFTPTSDFKHTIVFEATGSSSATTYIAGTVYTEGRAGNTAMKNGKISGIYGNDASDSYINLMTNNSNNVSVVNNKSVLVMDLHNNAANTITLNGESITGTNTGKITSTSPMSLFAYGSSGKSSIKLYRDTIEQNGVVVHDYVPAIRNSDSVAGLYDTITGDFLTNAGDGTFNVGDTLLSLYPEEYVYGVGANVYGAPVREHSVFEGWCRNAALTDGCTMVPHTVGTTEYGNKILWAKWSCVDGYTLNSNNQCVGNTIHVGYQNGGHGGTPNPTTATCTYGSTLQLADEMGEVGYVFTGWKIKNVVYDELENIDCNFDTLGVYSNTTSNSVPAVAQWEAEDYVLTYNCNTDWEPNTPPLLQNVSTDETVVVRQNTCVNPGYTFVKWAVSGTTPQEYKNAGDSFEWGYTENKTFSAVWERDDTSAFTVTVNMPANKAFKFTTIATGQFWVDWDDGSNIEEYAPTTITTKTWTHTYTTAGTYDIKIGGRATGYAISTDGTPEKKSAISFFNGTLSSSTSVDATVTTDGTEQYITAVSGKLGDIFPTITAGSYGGQPRFYRTFKNTTNMDITLQSVADLFDGVNGTPVPYMFAETFDGSAVTGAIPAGLFPVSGAVKDSLFLSTFRNCTGLTGTIPANLFVNINGAPKQYMFSRTFRGCTGLTGIPAGLFKNISGAPAKSIYSHTFHDCSNIVGTLSSDLFGSLNGPTKQYMFYGTFEGCTKLTGDMSSSTVAIPNGLFGTVGTSTTDETYTFYHTFYGCSALNGTIGGALFGGLTGAPAEHMFDGTFYGCSNLTGSIPQNLFGNMTGAPKQYMFHETFMGDSGLSGSIPSRLFGGITGVPASNMFRETFYGCSGLTGTIPANLFANISGQPAVSMFYSTFYGCSHLSGIGGALFSGISGPAKSAMFFTTFSGCSGLQGAIPAGLFGTPTTPANWMFCQTFYGCSGLTGEIPSNLFSSVNGTAADYMFDSTFRGCSGLSGTIPSDLFGTLSGAGKEGMFRRTFYNCSHLTGYVPEGLFGTMTKPSTVPTDMMTKVFAGSGLDTVCPCGTTKVDSVFETYWDSLTDATTPDKVSCRVGLKPGEHWYNGVCTTECPDTAIDRLHVGNLDPYIVLADKISTVSVNIKNNDTICYVPLARGGSDNNLNVKYGNPIFHLDRPNDTPPAGFGQR